MELDADSCYEAIKARDSRFDGTFFVGVSSTGIYCRPVCTVRMPMRRNCAFFSNAASAERAGYRPCLRCRPEIAPGLAAGVAPVDAVKAAARWTAARIEQGALNEDSLESLAAEYGLSSRQLRSVVEREFGVTPVELAQTRRLLLAKQLLTDSGLPMTQVAQASGFGSLRRFNHLFKQRYGLQPTALRRQQNLTEAPDAITLKLAYRPPLAWTQLLDFLSGRGAAGVEYAEGPRYWRTVRWNELRGWISAEPIEGQNALRLSVSVSLMPALTPVIGRIRALFDLDANPQIIEAHLAGSRILKRHVQLQAGLRVPGAFDGFELALRAILGQQVTVKAATTLFGRFAQAFGELATTPCSALKFYAPTAEAVAAARVPALIKLGLTRKRAETVSRMARACADGLKLEPGQDAEKIMRRLTEIPGIGPWTAHYIAMRALRWPDAFPDSDLGLMKALNLDKARDVQRAGEAWRPWRAYACMHLWTSLNSGG